MTEKDINRHLKNGISEIAPNCFDEIMEKVSSREDIPNPVITTKKWANKKVAGYLTSVAACLIILAGSYGIYQTDQHKVTTIVELDVNPSIEFSVDKSDKVVKATALNGDGEEILDALSLEKEDIKEATLTVMDEMVKREFITKEKSTVLVSVGNDNEKKIEEIKENLSVEIVKHLEEEDIKVMVVKQTIIKDEVSESMAKEYNISKGKALLIKTVMEQNSDLKEEELAEMTVDEIVKQAEKNDTDLNKTSNIQKVYYGEERKNSQNTGTSKEITTTQGPTKKPEDKNKGKSPQKSEDKNKKQPTKAPTSDKKRKPTKAPEESKKGTPTKIPGNSTKAPEDNTKAEPTKAPKSDTKAEPTKAPEGNKKGKPTSIPEDGKKGKPTNIPEDGKKGKPTQIPEDDKKGKPTNIPEDDKKGKPTNIPEDGKKGKPTSIPEDGKKGKPTQIPDPHQKPEKDPGDSGREKGKDQVGEKIKYSD